MSLPLVLGALTARLQGQQPQPNLPRPAADVIASLLEPGEGLAIRDTAPQTGLVRFAAATGRGIVLPGMAGTAAADRALTFTDFYGRAFGLSGRQDVAVIRALPADAAGQEHVRLRQLWQGVPVTAGEVVVHLRGDRVVAANGRTIARFPESVVPTVAAGAARDEAAAVLARQQPQLAAGATFSEPRLEVFDRGMIDEGAYPVRLAWFIEASGEELREFFWVDAQAGHVLLHFSQLAGAKNRAIYNGNNTATLPGTLVRSEGGPASADAEVNQAYDLSGITYDYFLNTHGRDSYNGAGAQLRSTVHHQVNFQNAFWNGTQMVYGDGFAAADDVVAHELTHAVTEFSAGLFYYNQSGALNESFSDIFGEVIDLTDGYGNDTPGVRWLLAEDLSIGAIRNMMTPTAFGDPGKMSDPQFFCASNAYTNPNGDSGGVHINSGIPNHAFALMVDGGTYNGRTISGIGLAKAAKIQYRVLTTYLTSGSNFLDNANALAQACTDLVGTNGITAGDCTQVTNAVLAVEMTSPWACAGAPPSPPPAVCDSGTPANVFADTFESGLGAWTTSSTSATVWTATQGFAAGGTVSAWGRNPANLSDHRMTMTNAVAVPANGRMYFNHAFEFEHGTSTFYDGGVLEYSTNGTTWNSAQPLIDAGASYAGAVAAGFGNPLAGQQAFVRSSFGYTATRLNLASLAGQTVRFRFRVGTDASVGSLGWMIDNVRIYSCSGGGGGPQPPTNFRVTGMSGNTVTLAWTLPTGGTPPTSLQLEGGLTPGSVLGAVPLGVTPSVTLALPGAPLYLRMRSLAGAAQSAASNEILVHVNQPVPPSAPANLLGSASGSSLALAWTPTFAGGQPTNVMLDVSGAIVGSLPIGMTDSFQFAGVPPGTYTFRVRQENPIGSSAQSNAVTLTFPSACSGKPQQPANFVAYKAGGLLNIAWDPPVAGPAPTGYLLNVTGSFVGALPMGGARSLSIPGPPGTFNLSVIPVNACGSGTASAVQTVSFP